VLTDDDKRVALEPHVLLDLEEDSPELAAEWRVETDQDHSPCAS